MTEKIHCDLLALYGPNWAELPREKVIKIAEAVHLFPHMLGEAPEFYGFVGTRRVGEDIVGGYFAVQYMSEEFFYNREKELEIEKNAPFARIFFVLFAKFGKVLLQNSKFPGKQLNMIRARSLFKNAIDHTLLLSGVPRTFNIALGPEEATDADFVEAFNRSTRVVAMEVTYPDGQNIPSEYVYYNPQKERNAIIRESHVHDYPQLKKVDLEATDSGDLKKTHLRDLVLAGHPQVMRYYVDIQPLVLRRALRSKFEMHVDMDAEHVQEEHILLAIEMLKEEQALEVPTPLPIPNSKPGQPELFDQNSEDDDDENG